MNRRTTLILALILGALFAYVYFYDAGRPSTRETEKAGTRVLGNLERTRVSALTINQAGTTIDLQLKSNLPAPKPGEPINLPKWQMVAPLADRADAGTIDLLLNELENWHRNAAVPVPGAAQDRAKLAPFGLQNPRLSLKIVRAGQPPLPEGETAAQKPAAPLPDLEVFFGDATPTSGKSYVQLAGQNEVLAVDDAVRKILEKNVAEFRDHQLTEIPASEIAKLTVKTAAGAAIELAKDPSGHWRLLKPQAARASDQRMGQLINRLADLRITSFLPEARAADPAALGLAEPRGTLTFSTTDTPPRVVEVQLGKAVEPEKDNGATASPTPLPAQVTAPNTVYARIAGRPSVETLPKTIEDYLNLKPTELRDRQLVRIATADLVNRIRITPASGPELTLTRGKDADETGDPAGAESGKPEKKWNLRVAGAATETPANGAEAERLLTKLPAQVVKDFVADTASDLAKYGLDKPTLRVAFLSHSSETTAEAGAGEAAVATLVFGRVEGDIVYARLEEEPFIVSVDKAILDAVPTDPIAWQPLAIFRLNPKDVRTVTQTASGRPEASFERAPESAPVAWKLAGNNAAANNSFDVVKAQSLVNTLAALRATRWLGPEKPEYKLAADAPGLATIAFQTDAKPPVSGKLIVGQRNPNGMWYARVEGKPGVFLLSDPDYTTLFQPLTTAPLPASSPSPTASPVASPTATPAAAASP